jgi:hypothetical protein
VLVAIFGEKDSHAVYYLHQQGVTRLDVVNFISHGITKSGQGAEKAKQAAEQEAERLGQLGPVQDIAQQDPGVAPRHFRRRRRGALLPYRAHVFDPLRGKSLQFVDRQHQLAFDVALDGQRRRRGHGR